MKLKVEKEKGIPLRIGGQLGVKGREEIEGKLEVPEGEFLHRLWLHCLIFTTSLLHSILHTQWMDMDGGGIYKREERRKKVRIFRSVLGWVELIKRRRAWVVRAGSEIGYLERDIGRR